MDKKLVKKASGNEQEYFQIKLCGFKYDVAWLSKS